MSGSFLSRMLRSHQIWTRLGVAFISLFLCGSGFFLGVFFYFRAEVPSIRSLSDYKPPRSTRVYSDDGHLVGLFYKERRTVVPMEEIPRHVVHAFLAAEDAGFYEHEGLDFFGIFRAAAKNLRPGAHLQGASTITQQIVKTLVVGKERSYSRKMREAILSRELESMLSKDDILHLYLNQIYFGASAYGVEEAARSYFGKSVRHLDLGEAAYLASIPKNPSRYNLIDNPRAAKRRQRYVLTQMVANGWAEKQEAQRYLEAPIPQAVAAPLYLRRTPHYVEHVRRSLLERYGEEKLTTGGLTVYVGMSAKLQVVGQQALRHGLEALAKKQGYPGPELRIEVDRYQRSMRALHEHFERSLVRRVQRGVGPPLNDLALDTIWDLGAVTAQSLRDESSLRRALRIRRLQDGLRVVVPVRAIDAAAQTVLVDLGSRVERIHFDTMRWARRFEPYGTTPVPSSPAEVLRPGDLVEIEVNRFPPGAGLDEGLEVRLVPRPVAQGSLVAIDPYTRLVRALVGGYEQDPSTLIRATQSRRQPGSAFKPIVYTAAVAQRVITPASLCPDSPVVIRDPWTGRAWKPENYVDGRYDGNITYRTALTRSKNTCSVKLIDRLGPRPVIEMAQALGVHSTLPQNLTLALGTGEVTPLELANAYSTIAAGGLGAEPIFVRKVVDADGTILEENTAQLHRVVPSGAAFVVSHMMRSVVEEGTAIRARALERPLAGKTGTSQESRDVWFSGFSPDTVATVWVGFDDNKPLGKATGSSVALPIWIQFMAQAFVGTPVKEFLSPDDVVFRYIDARTGEPASEDTGIEEAFLRGTEPSEQTRALKSPFLIEEDNPFAMP